MERSMRLLRTATSQLASNGGQITPAIYDTAMAIRLLPEYADERTITWLAQQQREDGGWDDPYVPRARTVPTLAALLALAAHLGHNHPAIQAGITFLQGQEALWADASMDELPAGVELLVPALLNEAAAQGLSIPV